MSISKILNVFYILLLIAALIIIFSPIPSHEVQLVKDFHHSYVAAQALLAGTPLYAGDSRVYIYPPLYAFLLTPIASFSEPLAHGIWISVSILLLALTSVMGLRILRSAFQIQCTTWQAIGICSLSVLMIHNQIFYEFKEGQNDILVLFGFTLGLYWLQRKPLLAGMVLGVIAGIKYQALIMLPLLLFRARFKAVAGLLASILLGAFVPAALIGWNLNLEYLHTALRGFNNMAAPMESADLSVSHMPSILLRYNCSITNALARLFYHHGWSIQNALICAAILAVLVFFLIRYLFQKQEIAFIWRAPFTNPRQDMAILALEWQVALVCMLAFSPECLRRHLILAYNLNLLAILLFFFPQPKTKRWPVLLALVFSQFGELTISFPHRMTSDVLGLPGFGYLIFLLIMIPCTLNYYRQLYGAQPATLSTNNSYSAEIAT